jgi:exodeoxyribonuclease-5
MDFSPQQKEAMLKISDWYSRRDRSPFVLNGYAGTGKTTIAKYIHMELGIEPENVTFVAYTGKAALQLRKKGCDDATTVHKLLYRPIEPTSDLLKELQQKFYDAAGEEQDRISYAIKMERKRLRKDVFFESAPDEHRLARTEIIVVDESSMINKQIAKDLQATGKPIIYCGDPFQLPPVKGTSPVSELPADMMLTEVHRQALESPILSFATSLRNGGWFGMEEKIDRNGDELLQVVKRRNCNYKLYDEHDQILCASNRSRWEFNRRIQEKKILEGAVKIVDDIEVGIGDRIIFLANDHEEDIYNGSIGVVENIQRADAFDLKIQFPHKYWEIAGRTDDQYFEDYRVNNEVMLSPPGKKIEKPRDQHIDLAYAITCHKSQGSEWDSVFVHYEAMRDTNMSRWLYTAVTRARKRCTISVPNEDVR